VFTGVFDQPHGVGQGNGAAFVAGFQPEVHVDCGLVGHLFVGKQFGAQFEKGVDVWFTNGLAYWFVYWFVYGLMYGFTNWLAH